MLIQKKIFTESECDKIISLTNYLKKIDDTYINNVKRVRSKFVCEKNENTDWIFDKLKSFFESESGYLVTEIEKSLSICLYEKNCFHGYHSDCKHQNVFGIGVILNDNFVGGEKYFYTSNVSKVKINTSIGNTFIYNINFFNEVSEVTHGHVYMIEFFIKQNHIDFSRNKKLI